MRIIFNNKEFTPMKQQTSSILSTTQLTLTALMTALLCVISPFSLPIPFSPVPISFSTFILYVAAYVLGPKFGSISCLLYLLLGFVGLPVFSGFSGGIGRLLGPTGGYLIGYIFLILIAGFMIEISEGKKLISVIGMVAGTAITYIFGTVWLSLQMNLTFVEGLAMGVLPYLLGDMVKIIAALIIGPILKSRLKRIR